LLALLGAHDILHVSRIRVNPTPQSRTLLEKPAVPHIVKKVPVFYGTQKLIPVFT